MYNNAYFTKIKQIKMGGGSIILALCMVQKNKKI